MDFNLLVITVASIAVVGFMELLKNFLPENINGKILSAISLALSIAAGIGFCFAFSVTGFMPILVNTAAVIGLVQTSYNFVLKLILELIEKLKEQIEKEVEG